MAFPRLPRPRETVRKNAVFRGLSGGIFALVSPAVIVRRNATQKGLLGGNRGWLMVFLAISARAFFRKHAGRQSEYLGTEVLTKGQFVRIETLPPLTRRQRRALRAR
jgi:hypothetical protein